MNISKPLKFLTGANILAGLFFGYLFFITINWGIDDDADPTKIAWGHLAFHHFTDSIGYAIRLALFGLVLNWLSCITFTRQTVKTTKWAFGLTLLFVFVILCGAAIGSVHFYIYKPRGI